MPQNAHLFDSESDWVAVGSVRQTMHMAAFENVVSSVEELRGLFRKPSFGAVGKEIGHLDAGCRSFIAHSPFVLIGTHNPDGTCDVSPKGGPPGFVQVLDDNRLIMGELPGNNRLDTFTNVVRDTAIGLMFLTPAVGEMLRVNGRGYVSTDPTLLLQCVIDGREPKVVLAVQVTETFLHCAKAIRRSGIWDPTVWPDTTNMVSSGCMFNAAVGIDDDADGTRTTSMLEADYQATLWHDR